MGVTGIRLEAIRSRDSLPDTDGFGMLVEAAVKAMDLTDPVLRPRNEADEAGGLLCFSGDLPTILVPDLHARRDFFFDMLQYRFSGDSSVLESLEEGTVRVVCVGDAFHSEQRCRFRWLTAFEEFRTGNLGGSALTAEIADSMGLMEMVLECIVSFPENFFFLKGNHENILNTDRNGNHPFRKYADEGEMFYQFFVHRFGSAFTNRYARFEDFLPLCGVGERFMVSHAEPRSFHDASSVINARFDPQTVEDFTWTGNGDSEEGTVEGMLDAYLPDVPDALYFGGHRPVVDSYSLRASNRYVQIHDPSSGQIACVPPDRTFDFETDMRSVNP